MEENQTPRVEEENIVIENEEAILDAPEIQENSENKTEGETQGKKSRIYGIIGLVAFVVLGGIGYCSWWMWLVVALLVLNTLVGESKKIQVILAAMVILLGTPVILGNDKEDSTAVTNNTAHSNSNSSTEGPSWIDGRWVYKGYVSELGRYYDVALDIKRSERRFVMVDNEETQVGTYVVHGDQLSTNTGMSFQLDNASHRIALGGGLYLSKR